MQAEVVLAVIPVAKVRQVSTVLEPIGAYGVSSKGVVRSVLWFGLEQLADLVRRGEPIYLTNQSDTSRLLLRLLCLREFGQEPTITSDLAVARGRLCIGDDALRRSRNPHGWPVIIDLSEWWYRQTGLPFVFARWMVRSVAPAPLKIAALNWLEQCVNTASEIDGRNVMVNGAMQAGLFADTESANDFFSGLRSRFDNEDLRGERMFLQEVETLHGT